MDDELDRLGAEMRAAFVLLRAREEVLAQGLQDPYGRDHSARIKRFQLDDECHRLQDDFNTKRELT